MIVRFTVENSTFAKVQLFKKIDLSGVSSLQFFQLSRFAGFVITGMCFAKLGIAKAAIGQFESYLWVAGLCSFFWITGLMNSLLAIFPTLDSAKQKSLLFNAFIIIFLVSCCTSVVLYFLPVEHKPIWYLVFNNPAFVVEFILFLHKRNVTLIGYGILTALLQITLCVWPVYAGFEMEISCWALVLVAVLKFCYALLLIRQYSSFHFDKAFALQYVQTALPLVLSYFVNGSAEYIDGAIVKAQFTLGDFSVFRYGAREFPLFAILAATLSTTMIPTIAANRTEGIVLLKKKSLHYMHGFFVVAILLVLGSRKLFSFFFSPAFQTSGDVFAALLLITIPRLFFPQTILTALGHNRSILLCALIEMFVNIGASWWLAQHFGLVGVAYGTVVAFVVERILMAIILYNKERLSPTAYLVLPVFTLYSFLLLLAYMVHLFF